MNPSRPMRLICDRYGSTHLYYSTPEGTRVHREFRVTHALERGYVYEATHRGNGWQQVCERLQTKGNAMISDFASLPDDIRREYRRMRRAWTKQGV